MNFKILSEHLSDPEYVHVLINPLPVYGLSIAVVALALALFLRTQRLTIAALVLVFICSISAWPTYHYGQAGYDRVKSMADDAGGKWLDEHMARAERLIWAFYVVAAVAALGVISVARWPQTSHAVTIVAFVLAGGTLGIGGYIAYAGGHVRHREFRFEPPPEFREAEHHRHGDEPEHSDEQKAATSPAQEMEHAEHKQIRPGGDQPPTEEEQKQLEASRLQLEASRLQLEASRKQLEATSDASPTVSPTMSPRQKPQPKKEDGHDHRH